MDEQSLPPPTDPEPEPAAPGEPPAPSGWIQPSPDAEPRRLLALLLAIVAVGVLAVVAVMVARSQGDPYDRAEQELGGRIAELPAFQDRFGDVGSSDEAFDLGQQLGTTALPRLGDTDLLRIWQLNGRLLQLADDTACARVMRQSISGADATELARQLEVEEYREFLELSYLALEAELNGTAGPPPPTDADFQSASVALASAMGFDTMMRDATTLQDPAATDPDLCAAARSIVQAVLGLEEPHRMTMLRSFVNAAAGA